MGSGWLLRRTPFNSGIYYEKIHPVDSSRRPEICLQKSHNSDCSVTGHSLCRWLRLFEADLFSSCRWYFIVMYIRILLPLFSFFSRDFSKLKNFDFDGFSQLMAVYSWTIRMPSCWNIDYISYKNGNCRDSKSTNRYQQHCVYICVDVRRMELHTVIIAYTATADRGLQKLRCRLNTDRRCTPSQLAYRLVIRSQMHIHSRRVLCSSETEHSMWTRPHLKKRNWKEVLAIHGRTTGDE